MPSQSWDFGDGIYHLIDSSPDFQTPVSPLAHNRIYKPDDNTMPSLGDFGKIYAELDNLGVSLQRASATPDPKEAESEEYTTEDGALFSDLADDTEYSAREVLNSAGETRVPLSQQHEEAATQLSKAQRRKACRRRKAERERTVESSNFAVAVDENQRQEWDALPVRNTQPLPLHQQTSQVEHIRSNTRMNTTLDSKSLQPVLSHINASLQSQYGSLSPGGLGIIPRSNNHRNIPFGLPPPSSPAILQRPNVNAGTIPVAHLTPRAQRNFDYLNFLMARFPNDQEQLVDPGSLPGIIDGGVHVFIDASNIQLGFHEVVNRITNGQGPWNLSFTALALLLERRRPVSRRVLCGSTGGNQSIPFQDSFLEKSGKIGYEQHILEKVYKTKELTATQQYYRDADRLGWAQAKLIQQSNLTVTPTKSNPTVRKWVEQGVDESLHLRICQSILDCPPATMVIATGDGNQAEFSDGFPANIERALKRQWKVELVSWRQSLNSIYRRFKHQWPDTFQIIELDEFLEFLVDPVV